MLGQHSGLMNPTANSWSCTLTMNPKHCPSGEGDAHTFRLGCLSLPLEASFQIWAPQSCTAFLESGFVLRAPLSNRRTPLPGVSTCPENLQNGEQKSWPFFHAARPMGHIKWKGKGAHSGMYHRLPPSLPLHGNPESGERPRVSPSQAPGVERAESQQTASSRSTSCAVGGRGEDAHT